MGPNHPPHRKRQCLPQLPSHATARPKVQTSSICFSTGASTRPRESQDQCRSVSELLHMRFFIQHTGIILGNSTCNKIPALDLWGLTHATIASVPGRPVQSFLAFSFSFTSSQQKRSSVWIKSHGQCKIWDFLQLHYCQVDIHCHHPACLACLAYLACLACLACRHMPCHTAYHCRMVCHMACHPPGLHGPPGWPPGPGWNPSWAQAAQATGTPVFLGMFLFYSGRCQPVFSAQFILSPGMVPNACECFILLSNTKT